MVRYLVYDVFTDAPFGGNPLAVVTGAEVLAEAALQKIAREFGYSETVFVFPPADPAHAARLRIFTPVNELPFAGHPTVGAAVALHDEGGAAEMVLELGIGPVSCRAEAGRARFTFEAELKRMGEVPAGLVARCGGLPEQAIRRPPVIASVGLPFVLAELTDAGALDLATPVIGAFQEGEARFGGGGDLFAILFYVRDGGSVRARMFAPLADIPEDPATGSAAATLAAHLADGRALDLTISQGVQMGRPSRIEVGVRGTSVSVAGAAVRVMEGRLVASGITGPRAID